MSSMSGYCTFTATARPSRSTPRYTWPMDAAAMGGHTGYAVVPGTDALRDTVAARIQDRTGVATSR